MAYRTSAARRRARQRLLWPRRIDWINPHAYVVLQIKEANGQLTTWALSTIPIAMLRKAGICKESSKGMPGETVTVTVNPAFSGRPIRVALADYTSARK